MHLGCSNIMVMAYICSYTAFYTSGSDDPDNLGHLGHFLEGQVGLICKINYLDVTRISHVC